MSDEYTVDELAQDAGIPTSTIRMYQNRGLLASPTKRGRVGIYDAAHRSRLSLIADLQERGFSLAAIKDVVESWEKGHSLSELLALGAAVPTLRANPTRVPLAEVAKQFPANSFTQEALQRSVELGLIEIDGLDLLASEPAFLEVGAMLAHMGIPTSEILVEYEQLQPRVAEIVERFQKLFERNIWEKFVAQGKPDDQLPKLADQVNKLAHAANQIVGAALTREFIEVANHYLSPTEDPEPKASTSES